MPGEELAGPTGTPAFAAPEQLLGEQQTAAVDLFALAAIVVFVLTGHPPFGEDVEPEVIVARALTGRFEASGLPAPVVEWAAGALAPNPEDRYADAGAMLAAWLRTVADVESGPARNGWWRKLFSGTGAASRGQLLAGPVRSQRPGDPEVGDQRV